MSDGAWVASVFVLFFGSATALAGWYRSRKNPDGTLMHPREPDMWEGLEEAASEYHAYQDAEREAVLRGRVVQEEILVELKAIRASLAPGVDGKEKYMPSINIVRLARMLAQDDGRDFDELSSDAMDRYIEAARAGALLGVKLPSPLPLAAPEPCPFCLNEYGAHHPLAACSGGPGATLEPCKAEGSK